MVVSWGNWADGGEAYSAWAYAGDNSECLGSHVLTGRKLVVLVKGEFFGIFIHAGLEIRKAVVM